MKNNNETKYVFSFSSLVAFLFGAILVGSHFVFGFTEPIQLPTGGNVSPPLDVSATAQTKAGGLILNVGDGEGGGGGLYGLTVDQGPVVIGNNYLGGILNVQGATSSPLVGLNQTGAGDIADFQKGNGKSAFAVTKTGILFSPMTTVERNSIVSPVIGLLIYNTTTHQTEVYDGNCWKHITGGTSGQCL